MDRFARFVKNAGVTGCVFTGVVLVMVSLSLLADLQTGHLIVTLPLLLAMIGGSYLARGFLLQHLPIVRIAMNCIAVTGFAVFLWMPRFEGGEPLWFRALIISILAAYMGSYFWILSDEQVAL